MLDLSNLQIGADPELFVRKKQHFVSAHIYPCGSKEEPMRTQHAYIQNDGIALEGNVRPSRTADDFVRNCTLMMQDMREFLASKDPEAELAIRPSIFIGKDKLSSLPPEAFNLGCTPDYNAWSGSQTPTPNVQTPFRTGAGHIHIGWGENLSGKAHILACRAIVRELDYYLGLPSLLWDKDDRRRKLYGRAGCFRPKPYGLEYRVLSNAWLKSETLMRYVFQQTARCAAACANPKPQPSMHSQYGAWAQEWINHGNRNWPKYEAYGQPYGQIILKAIGG